MDTIQTDYQSISPVMPIAAGPVSIFESPEFGRVRVVDKDGEPWFVAKDVCEILGTETRNVPSILDEDEQTTIYTIDTLNDCNDLRKDSRIISEPGLYSLILRSRKPEAKAFKRWITHDVLPSIRKHGMYATPRTIEAMLANPDAMIEALQALKEERKKRAALEEQAALDRPKVVFAESIETARSSILIGEMAKLIKQATGISMGQNRLFGYLRGNGYLHRSGAQYNMPTQRSVEAGWMEIKEGTRIGASGECHITRTTKITGKGQIYFINLFKRLSDAASALPAPEVDKWN